MKCNETLTQETMQKYALNIQFDEEYFYKERFSFNIHAPKIQITLFNLKYSDIHLSHLNSFLTKKISELIQLSSEKQMRLTLTF